jgi:hypothetical protein
MHKSDISEKCRPSTLRSKLVMMLRQSSEDFVYARFGISRFFVRCPDRLDDVFFVI